jgi:hypothetical protein
MPPLFHIFADLRHRRVFAAAILFFTLPPPPPFSLLFILPLRHYFRYRHFAIAFQIISFDFS